jgi:hypothetical protein
MQIFLMPQGVNPSISNSKELVLRAARQRQVLLVEVWRSKVGKLRGYPKIWQVYMEKMIS